MQFLDLLQWPAFAAALAAAYLVGSTSKGRRNVFLVINVLWRRWRLYTHAWALIALQVCLVGMNVRGLLKTEI